MGRENKNARLALLVVCVASTVALMVWLVSDDARHRETEVEAPGRHDAAPLAASAFEDREARPAGLPPAAKAASAKREASETPAPDVDGALRADDSEDAGAIEPRRIRIRDASGEPLTDAVVYIGDRADPSRPDARGVVALQGIRPGDALLAVCPGFDPKTFFVHWNFQDVTLRPRTRFTIEVRWFDTGDPVAGAVATRAFDPERQLASTLAAVLENRWEDGEDGLVVVEPNVDWADYFLADSFVISDREGRQLLVYEPEDRSGEHFVRVHRPGTATFAVEVRRNGAPAAGLPVHASVGEAALGIDAVTDAGGRLELPGLLTPSGSDDVAGYVSLRFDLGPSRRWLEGFYPESGWETNRNTVDLAYGDVAGTLVGADADAHEVATSPTFHAIGGSGVCQPRRGAMEPRWFGVNADGAFRIDEGWQARELCVVVRQKETGWIVGCQQARPGSDNRIRLPPSTAMTIVREGAGWSEVEDGRLALLASDGSGRSYAVTLVPGAESSTVAVPSGPYRVQVVVDGQPVSSETAEITGPRHEYRARLPSACILEGVVRDTMTGGVPGVLVGVRSERGATSVRSGPDGTFRVRAFLDDELPRIAVRWEEHAWSTDAGSEATFIERARTDGGRIRIEIERASAQLVIEDASTVPDEASYVRVGSRGTTMNLRSPGTYQLPAGTYHLTWCLAGESIGSTRRSVELERGKSTTVDMTPKAFAFVRFEVEPVGGTAFEAELRVDLDGADDDVDPLASWNPNGRDPRSRWIPVPASVDSARLVVSGTLFPKGSRALARDFVFEHSLTVRSGEARTVTVPLEVR